VRALSATATAIAASAALLLGASPAAATASRVNGTLAYQSLDQRTIGPGIGLTTAIGVSLDRALLVVGFGASDPAWSPTAARVAFAFTFLGNEDVYSIARDGQGQRQLTADPAHDSQPAWSPDGRRIAFQSDRAGDPDIYVMNADGADVRRLTWAPGLDEHPAWSPDGRRIAFDSARAGNLQLYTMAANGAAQTRLTSGSVPHTDPSWGPDGREIAFVSGAPPRTELLAIRPDTRRTRPLTHGAGENESPAWSPDGRQLAFSSNRAGFFSLYVTDAHGSPEARPRALHVRGRDPDWAQLPRPAAVPSPERTANAAPIGKVLVKPPGATAFERLTSPREIPLATEFDTRAGKVKLTTAGPEEKITTTTASRGVFKLTQTSASTELTMRNPKCRPARASSVDRLPPPDRSTLTTKVNGAVRVRGRHTVSAAKGTTWTMTLTCSRTTVKVTEGTVIVGNRLTRRTGHRVRVRGRETVRGEYSVGSTFG
jgi:dipeptidyl aminopeptidase/acylaminoacyl peptidase